jgi:hypothetical protein
MIKRIGVMVLCIIAIHNVFAQNIKRKGSLGVSFYQNVPDTLAKRLNYQSGAIVQVAVSNTTAAKLGILKDDIITQLNGVPIAKPNQLLTEAKKLRAGETVTVQLLRNGKEMVLQGTALERPRETSPTAEVIYGEFAYKNGFVRTILKTQKIKNRWARFISCKACPAIRWTTCRHSTKPSRRLMRWWNGALRCIAWKKEIWGIIKDLGLARKWGFGKNSKCIKRGMKTCWR